MAQRNSPSYHQWQGKSRFGLVLCFLSWPPLKKEVFLLIHQNDVYCIKVHHMKKRITITLSEESYIKLQLLAKKKKWSLSKTVEDILERHIAKQKPNAKEDNS